MERKKFIKSKRFWGMVIAVAGKVLPTLFPEVAPFVQYLPEIGAGIFGVGCMDAKAPLKF